MQTTKTAPAILSPALLPADSHRRIRMAASTMFLVDGATFGVWATLLPTFKERFALTEAGLSVAMLGMVCGALAGMPVASRAIGRWGSGTVIRAVAPIFSLYPLLLVVAPSLFWLTAAAVGFGALKGSFDVAVNSQAITVENAGPRRIMSTFQALWSIGGGLAALGTGFALKHGAAPLTLAASVGAVLFAASLHQGRLLLSTDAVASHPAGEKPKWRPPSALVLRLGLLSLLVLFAEGVMMDWSAVYTRTVAHASDWLAPFAFGVFSAAMAAGRLSGDWLQGRIPPRRVLRGGAILTGVGVLLVVFVPLWPATFAGLALCGLGLSNQVPILFGAGGRAHHGGVGEGVATVTMMGWFGFLAGPPAVGKIAQFSSLPVAFSLVAVFCAVLAFVGPRVLRQVSVG